VITAFETVLDLRPVEPGDDFFALGGHSLLALALCAEVRRRTGARVEPATIFAAPTPRALAATLASAPSNGRHWSSLVELRGEGTRPPLFVVTAGDGNPLAFAAVTRRLDPGQPVYALQPRGLDGRSPFDRSIPVLAARYLAEVRLVQPYGPYVIAGRCNGATVACEMAAILRAEGEQVALVAALDSEPPQVGPPEIVPGVRRDRIVDIAVGAARRAGASVPAGGPALRDWLCVEVAPGVTRYLAAGWRRRDDLREGFPDPTGADAARLAAWAWSSGVDERLLEPGLLSPAGAHGSGPTPYLLAIHALRPDLQAAFPDPRGAHAAAFLAWAWDGGLKEGMDPALLGTPPDREARLALERSRIRRRALAGASRLPIQAGLLAAGRGLLAAERRLFGELPGRDERLMRAVRAAAKEARAAYWAAPAPGRLVHLRSTEHAGNPLMDGWWALARDGVVEIPLDAAHIPMLREPAVAQTAAALQQAIDAALGREHALA
jgi:thioesterase domain-containing protein